MRTDHRSLRKPLLVSCLLTALASGAGAQTAADGEDLPESVLRGDGPWVVRAFVTERQQIDEIASWADVWAVEPEDGFIVVLVDVQDYDRLTADGIRVALDEAQTRTLERLGVPLELQTVGIPGFECYRTVEETYATADAIVAAHPDLATLADIGDSWEKSQDPAAGFDLRVLVLTQSAVPGPKPRLFGNFAIHAREYTTAELGTRFAELLVESYGTDPDVTWILDHHEIHLNLIANPDGRKQAETGLSWRKNTNDDYCPDTNSRGADLNRNFQFQWSCCGGSSSNECSGTFNGAGPSSEPEVSAIQSYLISLFPDQRDPDLSAPAPDDATGIMLDVHSFGEDVLWSWGFTTTPPPNDDQIWTLGRKYGFFTDYRPQTGSLSTVDGATKDFAYGELGVPGFTIELGTTFFQDCADFESQIAPDNLRALVYTAKVVRTPYLTPAGPEALELTVAPRPFVPGEQVALAATIDDTRYTANNGTEPTQSIAAADYFIDEPPWATGAVAWAMLASDGSFDQPVEAVEATVDTAGLAPGRHVLFVRGTDATLNDGALSAVFLHVIDPAVAPVVEGFVRDAATQAPLEAMVTIGGFVTASDPATGFYSLQVPPGTYDVAAEAAGYSSATAAGVVANELDTVRVDFDLMVEAACAADVDFDDGSAEGWTNSAASTCSTGAFVVAAPSEQTSSGVVTQVGGDHTSGTGNAFFTATNTAAGTDDVDGGVCIALSPVYPVNAASDVSIWYFHGQRDADDDAEDAFLLEISTDGGTSWSTLASVEDVTANATWSEATARVPAGSNVRFRLQVSDGTANGDIIEGGVDDLLICPTPCAVDADCDDGLFCNGAESCDPVLGCLAGLEPCAADQSCDEEADVCIDGGCFHEVGFEAGDGGWTGGDDTCTTGAFLVGVPDATDWQVGGGNPGNAFFTQPNPGGVGTDDVDGGTCEALSPMIDARAAAAVEVSLDYYHGQRDAGDDMADGFSIEVLSDGEVVDTLVAIGDVTTNAAWSSASTVVTGPGSIQLRVRATDGTDAGDIVEGGIDNVLICPTDPPDCAVDEDFEAGAPDWINDPGSTCTTGAFVLGDPTNPGGGQQIVGSHSGVGSFFTALNAAAGSDDVDGGNCVLGSPTWPVAETSTLTVWYWHGQRDSGDDEAGDFFLLEYSTDGGATWQILASNGDSASSAVWTQASALIPAGSNVELRLQCSDGPDAGDLVECGIDDVSICE